MAVSLATALRHEIERRHLTMAEAADKIGVTQPTVSRWLRGTPPDAGRVAALALFLDVPERRVEALVMQARRAQLEQRRSDISQAPEPTNDDDIELDFNSAMRHVPDEVRQAVIRIVKPYLDEE